MLHTTDTGSGPAILWIHGFPLASSIFEPQLAIAGFRHVMPDLPGFGRSRPSTSEMTIDDYARAVIEELDRRGIERAIFAGLSMGGYVCFAAWRLFRVRIAGLILIDTKETADTDDARRGRYESIEKVKAKGVTPIVEAMLPKMLTSAAPQILKERIAEIMSSASPEGVIAALRAMAQRPDSTPLLSTIDVPTTIFVGEEDPITPVADAERMSSAIRGSRLVKIPRAAHLSNYEQAEIFNASGIGSAR